MTQPNDVMKCTNVGCALSAKISQMVERIDAIGEFYCPLCAGTRLFKCDECWQYGGYDFFTFGAHTLCNHCLKERHEPTEPLRRGVEW